MRISYKQYILFWLLWFVLGIFNFMLVLQADTLVQILASVLSTYCLIVAGKILLRWAKKLLEDEE